MKKLFLILAISSIFFNSRAQQLADSLFYGYIGVQYYDALLMGHFNGNSYFNPQGEMIGVPKLSNGMGGGIKLGYMLNTFSIELAYILTVHDHATTMFYDSADAVISKDTCGKAFVNALKIIDIKAYFNKGKKVEFYTEFNFGGTWIKVKNVSYAFSDSSKLGDATYGALLLGIGGGIIWCPAKRVGINLGVLPEWYIGTDVKGIKKENYEIEKFHNFRLAFDCGVTYNFIKSKAGKKKS